MNIFDKFKLGLNKSSKSLSSGLNDLIFKKKIDEDMLNDLDDFLIQSYVGVLYLKSWYVKGIITWGPKKNCARG